MTTAIFVTHYVPSPVGHGGNHRAYQIWLDLQDTFGSENVVVASLPLWEAEPPVETRPERRTFAVRVNQRLRRTWAARGLLKAVGLARRGVRFTRRNVGRALLLYSRNPQAAVVDNKWRLGPGYTGDFVLSYSALLERLPRPAICFVQHMGFTECLRLNRAHGIPTVSCNDNLESFDARVPNPAHLSQVFDTYIDAAHEFQLLASCMDRLFISKVETALIGGLGLDSHYYPYLPAGSIRDRMLAIAQRRRSGGIESGLLLMVGTAWHTTTAESFRWFLNQATQHGLPDKAKLVVAGGGTESLLPRNRFVPGIDIRGAIEQDDLDSLMSRAAAILVPQRVGFGALTRLSELSCGGIPTIVSRHASYALDPTPGMFIAENDWSSWHALMKQLAYQAADFDQAEYLEWEACQARPIQQLADGWRRELSQASTK
jgi:hypothetical protein